MQGILNTLRENYQSGRTKTLQWRLDQLRAVYKILVDHQDELADAVYKDLGRCARETYIMELLQLKNEIALFSKELKNWISPQKVAGQGLMTLLDSCQIRKDPYGVVLVIGAWN